MTVKFPSKWRFVPILKGKKAPIGHEWEQRHTSWNEALIMLEEGWITAPLQNKETGEIYERRMPVGAIGVMTGVTSGGLLLLDHDGDSCDDLIAQWGEVPKTWMVTSGKPGHYQLVFKVPEQYWDAIEFKKYPTGTKDENGKPEQVEFRWSDGTKGIQSLVYGQHPETGNDYQWFDTDIKIAIAPTWMIEKMLKPIHTQEAAEKEYQPNQRYDRWSNQDWALSYLSEIDPDPLDWYTWRDCLFGAHAAGLSEQEVRLWSSRSRAHTDQGFSDVWRHIKGDKNSQVGLGTLGFLAKKNGWKSPFEGKYVPAWTQTVTAPTKTQTGENQPQQEEQSIQGLEDAVRQLANEPDIWKQVAKRTAILTEYKGLGRVDLATLEKEAAKKPIRETFSLSELMTDLLLEIDEPPVSHLGAPFGYRDLDALTMGAPYGAMTTVIARPQTGKSVFMKECARRQTKLTGRPVMIFTLEGSSKDLVYRLVASEVGISFKRLKSRNFYSEEEKVKVGEAIQKILCEQQILINDTKELSVKELEEEIVRVAEKNVPPVAVWIDQFSWLHWSGSDERIGFAKNSRELTALADKLHNKKGYGWDTSLICLLQAKQATESQAVKKPTASSAHGSDGMCQDGDTIITLHREELYNPDTPDRGLMEVCVAKNRNGETGSTKLIYEAEFMRLHDGAR